MKPRAGDVVLVPFPFTDQTGSKIRPAIVVSTKPYGNDVVIVFVTSQVKHRGAHIVSIKASEYNGLLQQSSVVCSKLASINTSLFIGGIGRLSSEEYAKIKHAIGTVLGF